MSWTATLTCHINPRIRLAVIIDSQEKALPDDLRRVAKTLLCAAEAVNKAQGYLATLDMEDQVKGPDAPR